MNDKFISQGTLSRFAIHLVFGFISFVFMTLFLRLIDIQLVNGKSFENLADDNKTYRVISPEERGVILDRYNDPLVYNKAVYYKLDSTESLYSDRSRVSHQEALESLANDSDSIRIELERMYLYPGSTSHVLGYVGSVSSDELLADSSLHISDKVGKFGLEKEYQDLLRGSKGSKIFEINALGEKQYLISEDLGIPGRNIKTTIDPYLSEVALKAMGDNKGAVVILDASNSEVLALVSTPSFSNSVITESYDNEEQERTRILNIRDFFSNPQKLFFNRAVSGAYPPGSVFKIITALAGLEGGKIDQNTTVLDEGVLKVGEYSYANWYFTQYGKVEGEINLRRAIARSNDIYFYKVAEWVGPEKIKEMAELFGLGEKTGIELQAEISGTIPDPEWKQRVIGERWFLGNTYHMGIGQGDILVSPLQVAQMVQAVSNNGTLCKATLVADQSNENDSNDENNTNIFSEGLNKIGGFFGKNRCSEVGVSEESIDLVLEGMLDACSAGGTGFSFFNYNSTVFEKGVNSDDGQINKGAVACKTGTSEFGGVDEATGYRKTHAWFAAVIGTQDLINDLLEERKDKNLNEDSVENLAADQKLTDELGDEVSLEDNPAETNNTLRGTSKKNRNSWLNGVEKNGFPDEIIVVVLVESDEVNPYKEGSKDAGPVVKEIFDWMRGE